MARVVVGVLAVFIGVLSLGNDPAMADVATIFEPLSPRTHEIPAQPLTEAQLDLISKGVKTYNASYRSTLAGQLDGIDPRAVAAAIPRAWRYPKAPDRVFESMAYTDERENLPFSVVLPADYDPDRAWPVHIHLHGGGFVSFRACRRFFSLDDIVGFILVCPMVPKAKWSTMEGEEAVMKVFDTVRKRFHVDADRVSLGGGSSGGTGTWHLGQRYPWMWSALVPRCAGRIRQPKLIGNIEGVSIYMIHGAQDRVIPVDLSRQMAAAFEARDKPFIYREMEDRGHDFCPDLNTQILPWLDRQKRSIPAAFSFIPTWGRPHGIMHWIEMRPPRPFQARLDRSSEGTVVSLSTASEPARMTVYLNDAMADLDKPVTVSVNGEQVWSGRVERSVETVLKTHHRTLDVGRTFTAEIGVRVR